MSEIEMNNEPKAGRRIHPAIIAGSGIAVAFVLIFFIWFFGFRGSGDEGKPVPAPRSTSMDDVNSNRPSTGKTITISQEQLASSGIKVEPIGEKLAADVGLTAATGTVEANEYRNTPVLPLAGGIVRSVKVELGQNVSKGQTVAVVFSNEFAEAQSRFVSLRTEAENAKLNYERTQRLVTINQPGRTEYDAAAKQVRSAEAGLSEMRNRYQRTTRLVAIGASSREELEQDTTKLRTAEAEVAEARNRFDRAMKLLEVNPETLAMNEEAINKLRSAEGELAAMRQRLILFGMSESRIAALRTPSQITSELAVPAPASGTVTSRTVNIGEVVEANKELIKVTDLSSVWVIAQAFEKDLPRLRVGSGASITTNAFGDRLFRGQVTYIDPSIDQATRTAKVRIELANADRALKLGMYVNVAFGSLGQSERTTPVVPASAVQNIGGKQILLIATGEPNVFELRPVRLGSEVNGVFPVVEGAQVGDRVVTEGSFMLRAEWLKTHQGEAV